MPSTTPCAKTGSVDYFMEVTKKILPYAVKAEPDPKVCPICKGLGRYPYHRDDGLKGIRPCSCARQQQVEQLRKNSQIPEYLLSKCSFDSFREANPALKAMKQLVRNYAEKPEGWLLLSGQRGGGKTHLAVAAAGKLMELGHSVCYMNWRGENSFLKRLSGFQEDRERRLRELRGCPVLLIDGFLQATQKPTAADLDLAMEILEARYEQGFPTILTTQWSCRQLASFLPSLADRIWERSKNSFFHLQEDSRCNYRTQ